MEPILGPRSVLLLDGRDHLRMRKLMLRPSRAQRTRYRRRESPTSRARARDWPLGGRSRGPRMQDITLEVILRAVFGSRPDLLARLRARSCA